MTITAVSDGHSTMYTIGDSWAAVNNGQPYVDAAGCWWTVTREEGWSTQPPSRAQSIDNPVTDGVTSSNLLTTARPLVLGGTVRAPNQLALQAAMDQVSGLLAGTTREDTFTVAEPHVRRHLTVRRDTDTQVAKVSPFTATWVLQLLADKPARLGDELHAQTPLPAVSGGLLLPALFPFTLNSTVVSGQCALYNPGTTTGLCRLRITGPVVAPVVTHVSTGRQLVFASTLTLASNLEWLDVDMDNHRTLANGQESRDGYVNQLATDWSSFDPGWNTWAFTASIYNSLARLDVYATPAWP